MTVSLSYKMQHNNNPKSKMSSSKKQRPRNQAGTLSAMGSDTSMSCVRPNYAHTEEEVSTDAAATTITTQATTRNPSLEEATEYFTEDLKQACSVSEPRVSPSAGKTDQESQESPLNVGEISKDWQSCVDGTFTSGTFPPNPPPSLNSTSSAQSSDQNRPTPAVLVGLCVPVVNPFLQLSENVPVPSRTDVIARVSREELCRDAASVKDDEESDAFASGEDLDMDKRSEYSTADEGDGETQYRRKVDITAQQAINEDEDSSPEDDDPEDGNSLDPMDSAKTDATTQSDPCGPTYVIMGANSEALKPVLVRQVSEDEEVRVTSDEEEMDSGSPVPCTLDIDHDEPGRGREANVDKSVIPTKDPRKEKAGEADDMSTSPKCKSPGPAPQDKRCDGAAQPIHWSDTDDNRSGVIIEETVECAPVECRESKNLQLAQKKLWERRSYCAGNSRRRSLPSLPIVESFESGKAMCSSSRKVQPLASPYPTCRSAGQCAMPILPLQSTGNLQQVKQFRLRQAMANALMLCEEELGPVAHALAQLQEKVRGLNLPQIDTQRRPVTNLLYGESKYLPPAPPFAVSSVIRTNPRMATGTTMPASVSLCLPAPAARQQIGWTHPGPMERITHDADCVCRYCGLQVGRSDASLSPVARMYILLAQSHRRANNCEESANREQSHSGSNSTSDQRI